MARTFRTTGSTHPAKPTGGLRPDQDGKPVPAGDDDRDRVERPDPTRFGDWEKNGRCIDF